MKFRTKPSDQVSGFLDRGTHVTGELEFAGTLRIDGNFHGSISTSDILIIGEHATVHADIRAGELEIHGQLFGTVEAKRRVDISPSGRVCGDIQTPVLSVSPGSVVDGRIRMVKDQPEETTAATATLLESQIPQERH